MEIAHLAKVPYPTASRIIQTLIHEGCVEREPHRKYYRPTALVQSLSNGFQAHGRLVKAARPHIVDLTQRLKWPVSVVSRVGNFMVVRDSTHALTPLAFSNYFPGYNLPILESASGRAYLAFAPEAERKAILEGERSLPDKVDRHTLTMFENEAVLQQIREEGFATKGRNQHNDTPGRTSSLAVPLFENEELIGALTLVFFSSAMKMSAACAEYAHELKSAAARIAAELSNMDSLAA